MTGPRRHHLEIDVVAEQVGNMSVAQAVERDLRDVHIGDGALEFFGDRPWAVPLAILSGEYMTVVVATNSKRQELLVLPKS